MYVTDTDAVAPLPVLIVDDTPAYLGVVVLHVDSQHIQVLVSQNGAKFARSSLLEVIPLHIQMVGSEGFETCQRLKAEPQTSNIPVIFVTASSSAEYLVGGVAAGVVVEMPDIVALIRTHLMMRDRHRRYVFQKTPLQQESGVRTETEPGLRRLRDAPKIRASGPMQEQERASPTLARAPCTVGIRYALRFYANHEERRPAAMTRLLAVFSIAQDSLINVERHRRCPESHGDARQQPRDRSARINDNGPKLARPDCSCGRLGMSDARSMGGSCMSGVPRRRHNDFHQYFPVADT